jgi:hypothetical protein
MVANGHHTLHLITSWKVDNAAQATRTLRDITSQLLPSWTVHGHLKEDYSQQDKATIEEEASLTWLLPPVQDYRGLEVVGIVR